MIYGKQRAIHRKRSVILKINCLVKQDQVSKNSREKYGFYL